MGIRGLEEEQIEFEKLRVRLEILRQQIAKRNKLEALLLVQENTAEEELNIIERLLGLEITIEATDNMLRSEKRTPEYLEKMIAKKDDELDLKMKESMCTENRKHEIATSPLVNIETGEVIVSLSGRRLGNTDVFSDNTLSSESELIVTSTILGFVALIIFALGFLVWYRLHNTQKQETPETLDECPVQPPW